jgi:hypothetical protein
MGLHAMALGANNAAGSMRPNIGPDVVREQPSRTREETYLCHRESITSYLINTPEDPAMPMNTGSIWQMTYL